MRKRVYIIGSASTENAGDSVNHRNNFVEPESKQYITDAGTHRRMSRIVKAALTTALQCLQKTEVIPEAIITATGLGCLEHTEKFMKTVIDNNEQLLNPTPFIQSTFNTVGAQIAIATQNHSYNITYAHRGFSFESAVIDACMKINEGDANNVLTGAFDETTDTSFEITKRLGFWRNGNICSEGAHFFMLSAKGYETTPFLDDIATVFTNNNQTVVNSVLKFLESNKLTVNDIDVLLTGENLWEKHITQLFANTQIVNYKNTLGCYQTVSAAALHMACNINKPNILIYNKFADKNHSFILLRRER